MKLRFVATLSTLFLIGLACRDSHAALSIIFDYTYDGGFFSGGNASRRTVLDAAATALTSRLADTFDTISPSGSFHWTRTFTSPSSASTIDVVDPIVLLNELIFYVGAKDLGTETLGTGGKGGLKDVTSDPGWLDTIVKRGESGITRVGLSGSLTDTDYAPWGGVLTFNSTSAWYFDADPSTIDPALAGNNDFYSVALHEIGHVLGIGQAPSWDGKINGSDEFTGANAVAEHGGNVPVTADGGHWSAGTSSKIPGTMTSQEAAMDPNLTVGTRKYFTDLDFAGLSDIGYEVTPVPEPQAMLLTAGCLGLFVVFLRRRKTGMA